MKITHVRRAYYAWPRNVPIRNGTHTWVDVRRCLVSIETDAGITGVGIGGASAGEVAILDVYARELIGMDPELIGAVSQRLNDAKIYGRRGHEHYALSSIDFALWDLKAKSAGMSLSRLLGGVTDRVPFYIAGGYYGHDKSLADLQREMASYRELGAKAVKMKVGGGTIVEDVARVRAVREVLGDDVCLMLDANGAYRAHEAVQFAERVADFDISWFEEPVPPEDYEGYRRIVAHTSVPIAAGEQEYGLGGFKELIETGIAILQPDARTTGGISEFLRISALCEAHGRVVSSHGDQQMHAHVMAVIRTPSFMEYYPPGVDPHAETFYLHPVQRRDGEIIVGNEPGGGWDVDEQALERFRIQI